MLCWSFSYFTFWISDLCTPAWSWEPEVNEHTHLHHVQSSQEAIQSHKDQRRLKIPFLDFLVLFEVSVKILPSVLKNLLEEVQGVHDHLKFSLTFFYLTSHEVFWAEIIRSLECKHNSVTKLGCECKASHNFVKINSEMNNCPGHIFQKHIIGNIRLHAQLHRRTGTWAQAK